MEEMNPEQYSFKTNIHGPHVGTITKKGTTFLPKVLLLLCLGLVVTFLTAFVLPYIIDVATGYHYSVAVNNYIIISGIIGVCGIIITSLVLMLTQSERKSSIVLFIVYAALMGCALSPLYMLTTSKIGVIGLLYSLLVTAGVFLVMGLLGMLLKGKIGFLATLAISLTLGSLILALVNLFVFNETVYWVTSFLLLAVVMIYTAIDFYRISQIGKYGEESMSELVACAFCVYNDFVILFLRILPIMLRALAKR